MENIRELLKDPVKLEQSLRAHWAKLDPRGEGSIPGQVFAQNSKDTPLQAKVHPDTYKILPDIRSRQHGKQVRYPFAGHFRKNKSSAIPAILPLSISFQKPCLQQ